MIARPTSMIVFLLGLFFVMRRSVGWTSPPSRSSIICHTKSYQAKKDCETIFQPKRRQLIQSITGSLLLIPDKANARNLPQTSNIDESKTGTLPTLIPIVKMQKSLLQLQSQLQTKNPVALPSTTMVPRDEPSFKKVLDAYSDPVSYKQKFVDQNAFLVYYSKGFDGPGRPNIEQDLPVKQTLQYGARNDAWVAWDDFLVEWEYYERNVSREGEDNNLEDLQRALQKTVNALEAYLSLVPADDLREAKLVVDGS